MGWWKKDVRNYYWVFRHNIYFPKENKQAIAYWNLIFKSFTLFWNRRSEFALPLLFLVCLPDYLAGAHCHRLLLYTRRGVGQGNSITLTVVLKSHISRYINEGNDVKTAIDMKAAIDSQDWRNVPKHDQALAEWHTVFDKFVFIASGEITVWRAYNLGPGKVFSAASLARLGTLQGPTNLQVYQVLIIWVSPLS